MKKKTYVTEVSIGDTLKGARTTFQVPTPLVESTLTFLSGRVSPVDRYAEVLDNPDFTHTTVFRFHLESGTETAEKLLEQLEEHLVVEAYKLSADHKDDPGKN